MAGATGSERFDRARWIVGFGVPFGLSVLLAACSERPASAHNGESVAAGPAQVSGEQIIELDEAWLARSWKGEPPRKAHLALLPAHPSDEEAFAPCGAPPRIAVRYVNTEGERGELLLACLNYCDPAWSGELWGRLTRLVDVDARTPEPAMVALRLEFAKLGFDPETGSSENAQGETVYEPETRTRPLILRGPFGPSGVSGAGSCAQGVQD